MHIANKSLDRTVILSTDSGFRIYDDSSIFLYVGVDSNLELWIDFEKKEIWIEYDCKVLLSITNDFTFGRLFDLHRGLTGKKMLK